jgi:hypothetical protein
LDERSEWGMMEKTEEDGFSSIGPTRHSLHLVS